MARYSLHAVGTGIIVVAAMLLPLLAMDSEAQFVLPAVPMPGTPIDPLVVAKAMSETSNFITGAAWTDLAGTALVQSPAGVSAIPITSAFATPQPPLFAVLSTGDVTQSTGLLGAMTNQPALTGNQANTADMDWATSAHGANDVTTLRVDVNIPSGYDCISFDFQFLTEEFPSYVGSFDDGFIAELDANTWSFTAPGTLSAPANFAYDGGTTDVTVNTATFTASDASGSIFNGGTVVRTAQTTSISAGAHSIYFTVWDASDHHLDSAVLLDNLKPCQYSYPPGHITIHQFPTQGPVLLAYPGGWACKDANLGYPVFHGSLLTRPNPGVRCSNGSPMAACQSLLAGGYHAVQGSGQLSVTSSCGPLAATATFNLPFGAAVTTAPVTGFALTPWDCVVDETQVTSSPSNTDYWVFCEVNTP